MKAFTIHELTKADDRFIKDMSMEEISRYLQQAVFFAFMEDGRKGFRYGARTVFEVAQAWYTESGFVPTKDYLAVWGEYRPVLENQLVTGFVNRGSDGLYSAVIQAVVGIGNMLEVKLVRVIYADKAAI